MMIGSVCLVLVGVTAVTFLLYWIPAGFYTLKTGQEIVRLSFGKFVEVISSPGIHWNQPIGMTLIRISIKEQTHVIPVTTVLEKNGNPVNVSAVVVYKVARSSDAALNVQDHHQFVADQASAVVKRVISRYPYESQDADMPCLKKESEEISNNLVWDLQDSVQSAGVDIYSVRLNDLTYAPEIAQSMLMRQQAQALLDARTVIVDGSVSIVRDAVDKLGRQGMKLTAEEQNRLVTNLMLLICSEQNVTPTLPLTR